jgi:hypothetical protein
MKRPGFRREIWKAPTVTTRSRSLPPRSPPARRMGPMRRGQTLTVVVRHNDHAGADCGEGNVPQVPKFEASPDFAVRCNRFGFTSP